jgi:hypothetical protein
MLAIKVWRITASNKELRSICVRSGCTQKQRGDSKNKEMLDKCNNLNKPLTFKTYSLP